MMFKDRITAASASSLETLIKEKNLPGDFIEDGFYVKPNNGRFGVDANQYGPTNYWVTLYHFTNGKLDSNEPEVKQQFGF